MGNTSLKWSLDDAITKGQKAYDLAVKYRVDIEKRLKPGVLDAFGVGVENLKAARDGQKTGMTSQKSRTARQDDAAAELSRELSDIREMIKASRAESTILKAFGVGENRGGLSVKGVSADAKNVIAAYDDHKDWALNEAGIIEEDISIVTELLSALSGADLSQEEEKTARKTATADKNTLQKKVEDTVTRLSAIGTKAFRRSNPETARLFEEII